MILIATSGNVGPTVPFLQMSHTRDERTYWSPLLHGFVVCPANLGYRDT